MHYVVLFLLWAGAVNAATCPAAPDHATNIDAVFAKLRAADTEMSALEISNELWAFWADAPDEAAQEILNRGIELRHGLDFLGALAEFDALIAYCPLYAEGYNQRAFVNFLRRDAAAALPDLDRAVALSPRHVAAIVGRAMVYLALGQKPEAQDDLRRALALNPWLPERSLLEGPALKSGQEL